MINNFPIITIDIAGITAASLPLDGGERALVVQGSAARLLPLSDLPGGGGGGGGGGIVEIEVTNEIVSGDVTQCSGFYYVQNGYVFFTLAVLAFNEGGPLSGRACSLPSPWHPSFDTGEIQSAILFPGSAGLSAPTVNNAAYLRIEGSAMFYANEGCNGATIFFTGSYKAEPL